MESALRAVSARRQGIAEKPSPYLRQKAAIKKICLADRKILYPDLAQLLLNANPAGKSIRNRAMAAAHFNQGYRQKEMAGHLGRHGTTVSKILGEKALN